MEGLWGVEGNGVREDMGRGVGSMRIPSDPVWALSVYTICKRGAS
jgi:hypothetical protein